MGLKSLALAYYAVATVESDDDNLKCGVSKDVQMKLRAGIKRKTYKVKRK